MVSRQGTTLRRAVGLVGAVLLIGGCAFVDNALMPALTGESPPPQASGGTAGGAAGVPLGTTNFTAPGVSDFQPTGTVVGQRIEGLRDDLLTLQDQIVAENGELQRVRAETRGASAHYNSLVAAINTRLQAGTPPGNPELVQQWNAAQADLGTVNQGISQLTGILNQASGSAALAGYLLEATAATYAVRGGVEEDHRQLAILEDETSKTAVVIDRLMNEVTEDVTRATKFVGQERQNLTALSVAIDKGEYMGQSLSSRGGGATAAPGGAGTLAASQPLIIIRFDRPNVDYEDILYETMAAALDRRPTATFDLVAVAPATGNAQLNANRARRYAEQVLRSLTNMGLPVDRVRLSATASPQVQVDEVHIYVR